ncbi:MAG: hypothetical protein L3J10_03705 [Sulfurimonas sp.]|nr:hypothetical protein [Sulfurimonas sp.]
MNKVVLTFDLDWCSDEVLAYLLEKLISDKIPATFFITHQTILLNKIRDYDFFELGIHPNFMKGSTHGKSFEEVIDYCLSIVPEAISNRSHGLKISSNKLIHMMKNSIKIDCSLFMPNVESLQNFNFEINNKKILRVPYNWEDDYEFYQKQKKYKFENIANWNDKILDFHPIHVYLNSNSEELYNQYKLNKNVDKNKGIGTETMLDEVIQEYTKGNIEIMNLKTYVGII